jgi:hypothetical protein
MRPVQLFVCLTAMLCTGAASAQEAYVYDTVAAGTYVYDASSTGKLTLVKGSPFQPVGSLIGTNGTFLVTADTTTVFSYGSSRTAVLASWSLPSTLNCIAGTSAGR